MSMVIRCSKYKNVGTEVSFYHDGDVRAGNIVEVVGEDELAVVPIEAEVLGLNKGAPMKDFEYIIKRSDVI